MPHNKFPHLTPDGIDFATGHRHCVDCGDKLDNKHHTIKDHVAATWRHYLWNDLPQIMATTQTGHTIEGVVAVPARRILSPSMDMSGAHYCADCFPGHSPDECGGCGLPVDTEEEHTESEFLDKSVNGINTNYRLVRWHISCLPRAFEQIKK